MQRFIINVLAMSLAMTLWTPRIAQAQTGYIWTDISAQLTERQNRPVWAIARAGSYWFYTDGQDLWNGGQVYRYDGTTQVNITLDIRNAGLSRVDDIVSDGSSVLFLKNVVRLDNSFEILKWNGSSYVGVGSYIRNSFATNEGLRSIVGRDGIWYIVSTNNRLLRWSGDSSTPVNVTLPSNAKPANTTNNLYQIDHTTINSDYEIGIVPVANGNWIIVARDGSSTRSTTLYRYNGLNFTSIESAVWVSLLASNGTEAVAALYGGGICASPSLYKSNGLSFQIIPNTGGGACSAPSENPPIFENTIMGWDGSDWLIVIHGKRLYQLTGTTFTDLGETRDFLTAASGDGKGHILMGGAASELGVSKPTNPLTAKLLWVTEGELSTTGNTVTTGGSFGGDRIYISASGPRLTVQGDPSGFRVGNGKDFAYRVTATDADGVDRTDLYVNDARIKTCYSDTCEFRTTYWTNGATTRTVKFWVRSTDKRGYSTDTSNSPDYLTVDVNSTATAAPPLANGGVTTAPTTGTTPTNTPTGNAVLDKGTGISSWEWLDNNKTTLNVGESTVYNAGAFDDNGVKRIEIYVNGPLKKTCELNSAKGNQTCSATLYANDYPQGTNVFVNAKITDGQNKYTWTKGLTLYRASDSGSAGQTSASGGKVSAWNWFDPAGELKRGASTVFRVGGWAENGLSSIELYANGQLKKTCGFNRAYGNQDCSVSVYGNDYAAGTQLAANAKAIDVNGQTVWSDLKYLNVVDANAPAGASYSGANNPPSVWDWIEIAKDFITVDEKAKYVTGAWDENGLASIVIYVNNNAAWTCSLGTAFGNQSCSYEITGVGRPVGASVFVNAKVTDATGKESWTAGKSFKVMGTDTTTSADYAKNGAVSAWTDKAVYGAADLMTVYGNGSDPDGVSRVEIYVNGERVKTCSYANQKNVTCEATAGPFPNFTGATYAVTLFDRYGYETTTGYKSVAIVK